MYLAIQLKKKPLLKKTSDVNAKPWFYVAGRPHKTPQEQISEEGRLKKRKKEIVDAMPVMPPGAKVIRKSRVMALPLVPSLKNPSVRRHQNLFDTLKEWREKRKKKRFRRMLHTAKKDRLAFSTLHETEEQAGQAFKGLARMGKARIIYLGKDLEPYLLLNDKMTAQEREVYKERNKEYLKRKNRQDTPDEEKIYPKDPGQTLVDLENQRKLSTPQDGAIYGKTHARKFNRQ